MKLNLEKFEGYGSKRRPGISITKSFAFGLPPAFYQENKLDGLEYAMLFFDKKNMVVGIRFVNDNSEGGFKIARYGEENKKGARFVARSFFNLYNLDPNKIKGRYKVEFDKENEMFILFLTP